MKPQLALAIGLAAVCSTALAAQPQAPAADWATLLLLRFDKAPPADSGQLGLKVAAEGITLGEGRFGKAYDCGAGGEMSVPLPHEVCPAEEISLECWMRIDKPSDERLQRIVGRSGIIGFYLGRGSSSLTFYVNTKPNNWKSLHAKVPLKQWTHLAGTFDGQTMRLYVNGKLAGELANPGELVESRAGLYVGSEPGRGRYRLLGQIDEVRLSKIVRTEFMTGQPAQRPKPTVRFEPASPKQVSFTRRLVVARAAAPPKLDGKLDDAVWKPIPPASFVLTKSAAKPLIPTQVKAAYDDRCLYLAYRCIEKGQETQLVGTAKRDDAAIFQADAVETFLQPGGPGTPYYQIVANTSGGVFDLRWAKPRRRERWSGAGIRTAGDMGFDMWTLELAIPFEDLGVAAPKPGDKWRANFCRNELPSRELTAWCFTGGGFHIPKRFGVLEFGLQPKATDAQTGVCELRGTVLEADGTPVSGAPVRSMVGLARTDGLGDFRLKDLPAGEVAIQIMSPRYEPFVAKTTLQRTKEVAEPVTLKRVDPYRPAFSGPIGSGPVAWLKSSIDEPPDMKTKPTDADAAAALAILATPGEYESRAVALFANQTLHRPQARIGGLSGPGQIAPEAIDVRWTQRLLKRVQYHRVREDAVFSWRFLWRDAPGAIEAGQVRQLVATVKVPDDAKPGLYRGALELTADGRAVASLPVELRVAGFKLVTPAKRVGCYYSARRKSDKQLDIELSDIHEHGGSVLVWSAGLGYVKKPDGTIGYDTSYVRHAVELQKKHHIGPPFIVGPRPRQAARLAGLKVRMEPALAGEVLASADFKRIYAGGIAALAKLEKEMNAGEFVYTWMDEVMGRGRFEPYCAFAKITRELSKNRIYITYHIRDWAKAQALDPWVDIRGYHGHTLDWWLGEGHKWAELKADIEKPGDEAWCYYNIREICVTSEWVRLCNGYWLWRSPLAAHTPWTYYSCGGSPFDDLDSDHHDFAYAAPHPSKPEMVSTLEWECFREGYDDLRYIATLEHAIAKADANSPAAAKAKALLKGYWDADPRVPVQAEKLTAADYAQRRADMAAAIEALMR